MFYLYLITFTNINGTYERLVIGKHEIVKEFAENESNSYNSKYDLGYNYLTWQEHFNGYDLLNLCNN